MHDIPRRFTSLFVAACCLHVLAGAPALAAPPGNMLGRQSQNEGLLVTPAPGPVVIDGRLDDWDWSGRLWVFADTAVRSRYSVEMAAMWDAGHLYLAAEWRDPTPMFSTVDPAFNPNDGWKSDSWQMRVRTADRTLWITTWYFTPKQMPVLHLDYWVDRNNSRGEHEVTVLTAQPNGTDLGRGAKMAYQKAVDGKGFVQELQLPWELLFKERPVIAPGLTFQLGNEFLWGDPTGRTWPIHRYADNLQPGETSREFFWSAYKAWGEAKLVAKGNVPVRQYVSEENKLQGTVPIRVRVPKDAARFTLAINDGAGKRVRNLAGDRLPEDYTVRVEGDERVVEVPWDCLDDAGRLAPPGTYQVVGLTHQGLGAEYQQCFYNPGTPPWPTRDGSGAWGADHTPPHGVAAAGDWMILSWTMAEGGSGLIGLGPDGKKKWGEKRGATCLAADEKHVYALAHGMQLDTDPLCRFDRKTGAYKGFTLNGKPRPFELPLTAVFGDKAPKSIVDMAAGRGLLVLAAEGRLAVLNADSAELVRQHSIPALTAVALGDQGQCCVVSHGKVLTVDLTSGRTTRWATPGLDEAGPIALDHDGNVLVFDRGPDQQVKAFSPTGQVVYRCGKRGGRALRGPFDPQTTTAVTSVAVDHAGQVWVVEGWNTPRRVSVWGRDGKLVREYLGNTTYAASGCYLHDQDPELAYVGPMEFRLDAAARQSTLTQILWLPDRDAGETFGINLNNVLPQRFTSAASGQAHEYLYVHDPRDGYGHVVFMKRPAGWQPVTAVCLVGHLFQAFDRNGEVRSDLPAGWTDLDPYDGLFWNDDSGDGKVQRGECVVVPSPTRGKSGRRNMRDSAALSLHNGWGGRIGRDFVFYTDGLTQYRPLGFSSEGAPRYGPEGMTRLAVEDNGDLVPVPEEELLLCLSWKGYAGPTRLIGVDTKTGSLRWSYPNPYPGVHGSHRATMPEPGLLIGPLKTCGVAQVSDDVGRVFLLRGNLGQDYFLTTDGLFVGALFQDGRLPGESLPAKEEQLVGMPLEGFSHGSEPFNGWFGKQRDGKIRMTTGFPRQAAMVLQVTGLDTIRRFAGPTVTLDQTTLLQADRDNAARAETAASPVTYAIARTAAPIVVDGKLRDWQGLTRLDLTRRGQPERGTAALTWDAENLYVLFDVLDASPWLNEGKDFTRLFKTGDACDLQLSVDPKQAAAAKRREPVAGDVRVVFAALGGKPVAVLMAPVSPAAPEGSGREYTSPVGTKHFDRVELLSAAHVAVVTSSKGYVLEASLPLAALGLRPTPGLRLRGDLGFISSDAQGTVNTGRTYWSNKNTNLVSDLPLEAWLYPQAWGTLTFE